MLTQSTSTYDPNEQGDPSRLSMSHMAMVAQLASTALFAHRADRVRDSFQSLIGDLWLFGMTTGRFDKTTTVLEVAPLMALWNEQVPVPNPHTALAWFMICESGFSILNHEDTIRFALPQSTAPMFFNEQSEAFDSPMAPCQSVPTMRSLQTHASKEFRIRVRHRADMYRGDAYRGADLFIGRDSQTRPTRAMRPHWYSDDVVHSASAYRVEAAVARLACLTHVLTPILAPTSSAVISAPLGVSLVPITRHGLYLRQSEADYTPWTQQTQQIKLCESKGAETITHVPRATPFLWFGFSEPDAVAKWTEAYVAVRSLALSQLAAPEASASRLGARNPRWESTLAEHSLVKEENPTSGTKPTTDKRHLAHALDAMMANFQF